MIREAALKPALHSELAQKYNDDGLPPNELLRQYLLWERPDGTFSKDAVDAFIQRLLDSFRFANINVGSLEIKDDGDAENDDRPDGALGEDATLDDGIEAPKNPLTTSATKDTKGSPYISFPLTNGNKFELRLQSRVSPKDFERIKALIELSEDSLVDYGDDNSGAIQS